MSINRISVSRRLQRRVGALAVGAVLAACSGNTDERQVNQADVSSLGAASASAVKDPRVETWHEVVRKAPSPKDGCFHASYPSTTWIEVPCAPAPVGPVSSHGPPVPSLTPGSKTEEASSGVPSHGAWGGGDPGSFSIGNGADYFAKFSGPIYEATGSFPTVTGLTSPNSYSIQLNANQFTTAAAVCPGCKAWQQAVYSTSQGTFFEYWLLNRSSCPSGWNSFQGSCYQNSGSVPAPTVAISNLSTMGMEMFAGSSDTFTMTVDGRAYRATFGSVLGLSNGWNLAEFGVFGDGGGSNVSLSPNTTIVGQIDAALPQSGNCATSTLGEGGATGETNNLNEICCLAGQGGLTGITFMESNVPGKSCTLCGGQGQACCTFGGAGGQVSNECASRNDVCYSQTCEPCGGAGQLCCAGNTCTTGGDVCQNSHCGLPDTLVASPTSLSVANADGAGTSVNYASTHLTASGEWAGSVTPSFSFAGLPEGVTCAATNDIAPVSGPSTVTCTASPSTPVGTYTIAITETIGTNAPLTVDVTLTVTPCQPMSCGAIGYVCGSLDNGCGRTETCGTCPSGETCTAGACFRCAERTCPVPEFFNLTTCECQACPCGTIHVNGHYLCNVCRP